MVALNNPDRRNHVTIDVRLIDLDQIDPHPEQPRQEFAAEELAALTASLARVELLDPVQLIPHGKRFRLLAGERRVRAAKEAGWKQIPARVRAADVEVEILAESNLHHASLNPIETARAIALLCRDKARGGAGLTQEEVARRLRKDRSWAANMLRLLKLPAEWQREVSLGRLGSRQARALVAFVDRPDVLAAVAADRQANPENWELAASFEARLNFVAARLDALSQAAERTGPAADGGAELPGYATPSDGGPPSLAIRKLPEVNEEQLLTRISHAVDQLVSVSALERVQNLIDKRHRQLVPRRKAR